MRPARIILLLVAIVAGGLAAFLVTRGNRAPAPITTTEVIEEARTQVLVARTAVGIGERLTTDTVEWQDWPQGALRPEYVTIAAMPDAPAQLTGAVVRFEFFPGEPIREAKLVRSDQGYLSAVLEPGKRGVSVSVTAASSAGGFVVPNDHVDVVLTTTTEVGQRSEVVLSDVRVLAIGQRLGEMGVTGGNTEGDGSSPTPETFDAGTIATLELDPGQAETLINSASLGQLTLTLRSVADFNRPGPVTAQGNQSVRLIRYGREQSVVAGTTPGANPAMSPPAVPTYETGPNLLPPVAPQVQTAPEAPQVVVQ
jgi:pilus assembly protein CpaB